MKLKAMFRFLNRNRKRKKGMLLTKGFVQLGLDVETIISGAYPGFGFGGRNSVGH